MSTDQFNNFCLTGDLEVVKSLISHSENIDWNGGLRNACEGGHMEIAKLIISCGGVTDWDGGLKNACGGGHMEIVKLLISHGGITDWDGGLESACQGGHVEIVKLMISHGASNWNNGLVSACRGGYVDIVKLMISYGANDWNNGFLQSCQGGHVDFEILKLMILHGASGWNGGMCDCEDEQMHFVRVVFYNTNSDEWYQTDHNNLEIVKLTIEHGVNLELHLSEKTMVSLLNIGCPIECFLNDKNHHNANSIVVEYNKIKVALQTWLFQQSVSCTDLQGLLPLDVVNYCIVPYINYEETNQNIV